MSFALPLTAPHLPRALRVVAIALFACGLGAGPSASPASATPVPAQSAGAFRDSVGVQMHHSFTGYAYQSESAENLGAALRGLGIRHVRDSACLNTEAACAPIRAKLADLRDAFGPGAPSVDVLLNLTQELKSEPHRAARDADIERALQAAQSAPLAGMVSGLEAVNEPDLKGISDWESKTLADDATTTRLLTEPRFAALRSIPRLTPAIGHVTNTPRLLGAGWSGNRPYTPNFHPYPPAWGGPENALTTPCSGNDDALDCVRQLGSGAAPIASESGYTTAGGILSQSWVSERAQATYLPRLVLENFSQGVSRTYLYELIDLQPERTSSTNGYGLWRARRSGNNIYAAGPKPAAWALARLNAAIGDLGAPTTPAAPLDLTLRVDGQSAGADTVRRVLLQRADGSYALALWQPKAVFDNAFLNQRDRAVADIEVDVTLGTPRSDGWAATAYRPSRTGEPVGRLAATSRFSASVGPDVTLIDLRGASEPATALPASRTTLALGGAEPAEAAAGLTQIEAGRGSGAATPVSPPSATPAPAPPTATTAGSPPAAPAAPVQPAAIPAAPATSTPAASVRKQAAARSKSRARARAKAKAKRAKAAKAKRAKAKRAKAAKAKAKRAKAKRAKAAKLKTQRAKAKAKRAKAAHRAQSARHARGGPTA